MRSAKEQLHSTSKKFTRSLAVVLIGVWALSQIYIAKSGESRIRKEVENWTLHNKPKIEEYLYVENVLALSGLVQSLVDRLDTKQSLEKVFVASWDGKEIVVYPPDATAAANDGAILMSEIKIEEGLKFADRNLGSLVIHARRDVSAMIFDSSVVALLLSLLFIALLYLRNILISEVDRNLVRPMQLLRSQMKSGQVLDLGVTEAEKNSVWSKESVELEQSYVELIGRLAAMTKQRESEAKLLAAGEVTARVAHDIRSPLMALEIAAANMSSASPEVKDLITQANKRIRDIAASLFAQAKELNMDVDDHSLSERMNRAIEDLIAEKTVRFSERLESGDLVIQHSVSAPLKKTKLEPEEIARLVSNLLDNAIEASDRAGKVALLIGHSSSGLQVTVTDTGKGIPESNLEKLGQPGFTFGKADGSGYGLYSVKRAVESCGGELGFDSLPGRGTTVTASIPFA